MRVARAHTSLARARAPPSLAVPTRGFQQRKQALVRFLCEPLTNHARHVLPKNTACSELNSVQHAVHKSFKLERNHAIQAYS